MKQKTIIKGGRVIDGSGSKAYMADLLLANGQITAVGKLHGVLDAQVVDAIGKVVAPGFIDAHRHADFTALRDDDFGVLERAQGITAMIVGNCGLSAYPVNNNQVKWFDFLAPCLGGPPPFDAYESYGSFAKAIGRQNLPVGIGGLVGVGAVKTAVRGFSPGEASPAELAQMQSLLRQSLEEGALGISAGIMYTPECYSDKEEYIRLLKPLAAFGRPLCMHIRSEGSQLLPAVDEAIEIAAGAGLPLVISHFKSVGMRNWGGGLYRAIERIDAARANGQPVWVDVYPYTGGSTTLLSLLPPSLLVDGPAAALQALCGYEGRARLREELTREHAGWDNMVAEIGWERILLSSVESQTNQPLLGKSLAEACTAGGYRDEIDCLAGLLCEERGRAGIVVMSMSSEDVDAVARLPYASFISDALYGAPHHPHPRLYGSFAKFIEDFAVNRGVLPLEEAVRKMSGMPAEIYGLKKHGFIKKGQMANLVWFKPEDVRAPASFENPKQLATGMKTLCEGGVLLAGLA